MNKNKAFTLVEILVVIFIMMIFSKIAQCPDDNHIFYSSDDFILYLLGFNDGGRVPSLHVSGHSSDSGIDELSVTIVRID